MKLLEAEPQLAPPAAPGVPGEPAPETTPSPSPDPGAVACRACGAAMEPSQDWCLTCGTAAPGRLGSRPGWRAVTTVLALTLLLVGGAVAASYAALTEDRSGPAPPGPVAQAPPATPPATPPAEAIPPVTDTTPSGDAGELPKVKTPKAPSTTPRAVTPITPVDPTPTPPAPSNPSTSTGTGTGTTTTPQNDTENVATEPPPARIELAGDAGLVYDPYQRAAGAGDAAKALDGNAGTSWFVTSANPDTMGIGYAVDLGKKQPLKELELLTKTPGFRVEVYATGSSVLPPDVLDTRWNHITDRPDVDASAGSGPRQGNTPGDDKERIKLGSGTREYRHLLLWFTQLPEDGPTLRISELRLFG